VAPLGTGTALCVCMQPNAALCTQLLANARVCRMCVLTFPCCPIAGGGVRCRLRADSVASTCCNMVWRGRKGRVAHTRSARSRVTERSPSAVPHWGGIGHWDIESVGCLGHSLGTARRHVHGGCCMPTCPYRRELLTSIVERHSEERSRSFAFRATPAIEGPRQLPRQTSAGRLRHRLPFWVVQ
jgi:hypothetical protein